MSSKKKNVKVSWIELTPDEYVLNTNKVANLDESFSSNTKDVQINTSSVINPTISNGIFLAEVQHKKTKDQKLSENLLSRIVEIHPTTMQLCGITIGGPVVIYDTSYAVAYSAWPSRQVSLGKVALSSQQSKSIDTSVNSYVHVTAPPHDVAVASSMTLSSTQNCSDSEMISFFKSRHFQKYLSQYLDRIYVMVNQEIDVTYFGKPFTFTVESIEGSNEENPVMSNDNKVVTCNSLLNDTDSLENSLCSLSIHSNKNVNNVVTECTNLTSTPLKEHLTKLSNKPMNECNGINNSFLNRDSLNQVFMITTDTTIHLMQAKPSSCPEKLPDDQKVPRITFDNIGGLKQQIQALKDLVLMPIRNYELFKTAGIKSTHGVLLHGPPGTGKSLLAMALANEVGGHKEIIRGSEIMSRFFGESEKQLRSIFDVAKSRSPCVVIIDEIDTLCPRRDTTHTDVEKRIVSAFITILDELNSEIDNSHLVVIATTNRVDSVDPALRRAGRFDREIEVNIPPASDRIEILEKLLVHSQHVVSTEQLETICEKCHGYVGADLSAVCVEAGLAAVKRFSTNGGHEQSICITYSDLEYGLKQIPPSAMRELIVQVPKVHWTDIGGNNHVKKKLKQAIEWPLKNPESFRRLGIYPPRGVLLYGPPGCSKTLTAKALATESGLNFISIKGPELFSKYVGDSERAIRRIFSKARSAAPAIVFIDELDALAIERGSGNTVADRVLAALLTEMDGVEQRNDVIVVAATNRPDMIDKAFLRPGRIDRILLVPLPDDQTRDEIFRIQFRKMAIADDVIPSVLVERTEMYSGAEICSVCREAALAALDDDINAIEVAAKHFALALKSVLPQTTADRSRMYEEYGKTLQTRIK